MESRLMNFGARLYCPQTGRFLSVDPLWQAFRSLTPYHYAYNSPLSYKDPTGLAPVKEKGERVMANLLVLQECSFSMSNYYQELAEYRAMIDESVAWMLDCQMRALDFYEKNIANKGGGRVGASTSDRTGVGSEENESNGGNIFKRVWNWLTKGSLPNADENSAEQIDWDTIPDKLKKALYQFHAAWLELQKELNKEGKASEYLFEIITNGTDWAILFWYLPPKTFDEIRAAGGLFYDCDVVSSFRSSPAEQPIVGVGNYSTMVNTDTYALGHSHPIIPGIKTRVGPSNYDMEGARSPRQYVIESDRSNHSIINVFFYDNRRKYRLNNR